MYQLGIESLVYLDANTLILWNFEELFELGSVLLQFWMDEENLDCALYMWWRYDLISISCAIDLLPWQVYLPAIAGYVPPQMVHAISAFMEFCYLVHHSVINDDDLITMDNAMANFHCEHIAFNGIYPDGYSLSHQHSIVHYKF